MELKVQSNAIEIARWLQRDVTDQLPDMTANALNNVRERITKGERAVMMRVFDRPTPYTQRSFYATKAKPGKLQTETGLRDWSPKGTAATRYMAPHVYGGARKNTKFENLLAGRGIIPKGSFLVPASGVEMDSYGNVKRGTHTRILSALGAMRESGSLGNRSQSARSQRKAKNFQVFVGRPQGEDKIGIWQRVKSAFGDGVKPLFFVQMNAPRYRKRWAFHQIAENITKAHYERELNIAITATFSQPRA